MECDEGVPNFLKTPKPKLELNIAKTHSYDILTGLPDSNLFFDRLAQSVAITSRTKKIIAVLFVSADRLKVINDTLGEAFGNRLLIGLVKRLQGCIRQSDTLARPGRDEFVILLPEIRYPEDAAIVARSILSSMEKPFVLNRQKYSVKLNIGISVFPDDAGDPKALLSNAYTAMQRMKELRKNTYQFYSPAMTEKAFERMVMETGLERALQREEFLLYYQPQIDLRSGLITGVEALARWQKPGVGLVYPGEFLPLMEEMGLTIPLGEWALRSACMQNMAWQKAGLRPIRVAVNISADHFHEHDITHTVSRVLEDTGLAPQFLELELTESIFLRKIERTIRALKVLRKMGVNISIDDFGTGYSSLAYLKYFPMSKVKIVEPFISSVAFSSAEGVVARAIIAMAHTLNMKVIAEGVEKKEQLAMIRSLDCDELQGNLISRPLPAGKVVHLLAKEKRY